MMKQRRQHAHFFSRFLILVLSYQLYLSLYEQHIDKVNYACTFSSEPTLQPPLLASHIF